MSSIVVQSSFTAYPLLHVLSGYYSEYPIAFFWRLQEIFRHRFRDLVILRPSSYNTKVTAHVFRVEINICLWILRMCRLEPDLTKNPDVHCTHQLLSYNVQTMGCCETVSKCYISGSGGRVSWSTNMFPQYVIIIHERSFSLLIVILIVVVQRFAYKILGSQN